MLSVIDFVNYYYEEREKAFKVLMSCINLDQLTIAKNYFSALKRKWGYAQSVNPTIKLIVDVDEMKFNEMSQSVKRLFV